MPIDDVAIAIINLDRKISRALERGKGIGLTADQLDVLAGNGLLERPAEAKATILKAHARSRQKMGTHGGLAFEPLQKDKSEAPASDDQDTAGHDDPAASGMTPRERARVMFG